MTASSPQCTKTKTKKYQSAPMQRRHRRTTRKREKKLRAFTTAQITNHTHHASSSPPKIALLFLTRADHEQPKLWQTFLNNHHHQFSVYCHPACAKHVAHHSFLHCTPHGSPHEGLLPAYKCIPKPNNRWGHLTLAYYQLLHHAFNDTENNNQRFVYVSETCVPCTPADTAYKHLTSDLDATLMDAPQPTANSDRYDQTIKDPSSCAFPNHKPPFRTKTTRCATLLERSGVLREHFFKHSGWFSPNRRDAERLLKHKDAFEALNMISAGDEHILSILQRPSYKPTTKLKKICVTHVDWDYQKMQKCKTMLRKENDAFWANLDAHPAAKHKYIKKRNELKEANMHPIQYNSFVPTTKLQHCKRMHCVFLRKVRRSCNTYNIHKMLLHSR